LNPDTHNPTLSRVYYLDPDTHNPTLSRVYYLDPDTHNPILSRVYYLDPDTHNPTLSRVYYHDSNGTEVQLLSSSANTTDWTKQSLPLKNQNMWRVKVVGKLSDEWFGGIGLDDIDITGCSG
jgi:hypothetical protein